MQPQIGDVGHKREWMPSHGRQAPRRLRAYGLPLGPNHLSHAIASYHRVASAPVLTALDRPGSYYEAAIEGI